METRSICKVCRAEQERVRIEKKKADPALYEEHLKQRQEVLERHNEKNKSPERKKHVRGKRREEFLRNRENLTFVIKRRIRCRVRSALVDQITGKVKDHGKTEEMLGCTILELISYLEGKFTEHMTWDLVRSGKIHIDHVIALADFDLADPEQQKIAFGFRNLQPLWKPLNLSKGKKRDYVPPAHIMAKVQALIAESQVAIQQAA